MNLKELIKEMTPDQQIDLLYELVCRLKKTRDSVNLLWGTGVEKK